MRPFLVAAFLAVVPVAQASEFSTDVTDLWWNPNESGWGVNLIQQENVVFATLFVYGPFMDPVWYVGSSLTSSGVDANGVLVFNGPWFQTTGPYFGGPFDPNTVSVRQVGTATFELQGVSTGRFTYSIDGQTFVKNVTRQTWRFNNLNGGYLGYELGTSSGCPASADNGSFETPMQLTVAVSGNNFLLTAQAAASTCNYTGLYNQEGRMGSAAGNYGCDNNRSGTFTLLEVEGATAGFRGRLAASDANGCVTTARIGGVRRN